MAEYKIYFTYNKIEDGRWLGVLSQGHPQLGDEHITVLAVEADFSLRKVKKWAKKAMKEKPWETKQ